MRTRSLLLPFLTALFLAACNDQSAEAPNEYDVGPTEEAAPVEEPAVEEEGVADAPPTDLTPTEQAVSVVEQAAETLGTLAADQLNQMTDGQPLDEAASELASDVVTSLSEQVNSASEGLSQIASDLAGAASETADAAQEEVADDVAAGQTAAEEVASDVASTTDEAVDSVQGVASAIGDQLSALVPDQPADVDWQTSFSPDVPYYNLSEEPVMAYDAPEGTVVVATISQGQGGFIETCNAALDWCEIALGDGSTGWVDMEPFGGVAN